MTPKQDPNPTTLEKIPTEATPTALTVPPVTEKAVGAVIDYGEDSRRGFENTTSADITLPFMKLLQVGSPEVSGSKGPERKVQGAQAGSIMNSASRELLSELFFVPCDTRHEFVEWRQRNQGGGFVNRHDPKSPFVLDALKKNGGSPIKLKCTAKNDKGEVETHELKETYLLFGLILSSADAPSSEGRYACIAFESTKIKPYKDIMYALYTKIRAPIFANRLRLATAPQSNAGGDSFNFVIKHAIEGDLIKSLIPKESPLYAEAKGFADMVSAGKAQVDYSKSQDDDATGAAEVDGKHF